MTISQREFRSGSKHFVENFFGGKQFSEMRQEWKTDKGKAIGMFLLGGAMAIMDATSIADFGGMVGAHVVEGIASKVGTKAAEDIASRVGNIQGFAERAANAGDRYISGYTSRQLQTLGEDKGTISDILAKEKGIRNADNSFAVHRSGEDKGTISDILAKQHEIRNADNSFAVHRSDNYGNFTNTQDFIKYQEKLKEVFDDRDTKSMDQILQEYENAPFQQRKKYEEVYKRLKVLQNIRRRFNNTMIALRTLQVSAVLVDTGISTKETFFSSSSGTPSNTASTPVSSGTTPSNGSNGSNGTSSNIAPVSNSISLTT
jgi:hypothetical protein